MKCGSLLPALILALPASALGANAIGVFTAEDCASGSASTPAGETVSLRVCIQLLGSRPGPTETSNVYVEASLRIAGLPRTWNAVAEPVPGVVAGDEDDPLSDAGARVVAPIGEGNTIPLYKLTLQPEPTDEPVVLTVAGIGDGCASTRWMGSATDGAPLCADTPAFILTVEPPLPVFPSTWSRLKARFGGDDRPRPAGRPR